MTNPNLMTVKQVAVASGLSEAELWQIIGAYHVPTINMRGRVYVDMLHLSKARRRRDRDRNFIE